MTERNVDVSYFLDFMDNNIAIWAIRIIVAVGVLGIMGYYFYKHKQLVEEHNKSEN